MLKNLRRSFSDLDSDDLLEHLGIQRRTSAAEKVLPALAFFGVGVAVGAGLGLLLAPTSGVALRGDLQARFAKARDQLRSDGTPQALASAPVHEA